MGKTADHLFYALPPSPMFFAHGDLPEEKTISLKKIEIKLSTKKRKEPVFRLENECPNCGHSSPYIYTPDLLKGNIDCECCSKNNPVRKYSLCGCKWSVAATEKELLNIFNLLKIAEEQDNLWEKIEKNRLLLGYHSD